jgi:hypothetical protein
VTIIQRILKLRHDAERAGLKPVVVEVPFEDIDNTVGPGLMFGMTVRVDDGPLAVLALPSRKIGRYECVAPVRFSEAA